MLFRQPCICLNTEYLAIFILFLGGPHKVFFEEQSVEISKYYRKQSDYEKQTTNLGESFQYAVGIPLIESY